MLLLVAFLAFADSKTPSVKLPDLPAPVSKTRFEPNLGRYAEQVQYVAYLGDGVALFTADSVVDSNGVSVMLYGSHEGSFSALGMTHTVRQTIESDGPLYVPRYTRLIRRNAYPGIDVVYQLAPDGDLEVHFFLQAEAKLNEIGLSYVGVEKIEMGKDGSLVLKTMMGKTAQRCPTIHRLLGDRYVTLAVTPRLGSDGVVRLSGRAVGLGN